MKQKFFRIISPIILAVVLVLDIAILAFAVFSVRKLISFANFYAILFGICELFAIVLGVFVTKDVVTQGIIFKENELEFTHMDTDNIFSYDEILSVETQKDKKASFVKNFKDRQSKIILNLTEDRVVSVDIGLTSDKTLKAAADEIISRIPEKTEIASDSDAADTEEAAKEDNSDTMQAPLENSVSSEK